MLIVFICSIYSMFTCAEYMCVLFTSQLKRLKQVADEDDRPIIKQKSEKVDHDNCK